MGRLPACDVVLTDTKASRRHARLHVAGSVVEVEDLQSHNGTLLNGKPVQRRVLRDGDQIQIGTTTIVFRETAGAAPGAPVATPPSPAATSPSPPATPAYDDDFGGVDLTAEFGGVDLTDELVGGGPPPAAPRPVPPPPRPAQPPIGGGPVGGGPVGGGPVGPGPIGAGPEELVQPRQRAPESSAPRPAAPAGDAGLGRGTGGSTGSSTGSGSGGEGEDVDVVEFADEVVQVRRREVKPSGRGPGGAGGGGGAGGAAPRTARVEHGVLQFSRQASSSTVATDDLRQMSSALRALLILVAVAIAIGLGWLAMVLAR